MNCQDFASIVELEDVERAPPLRAMRRHLGGCADCRSRFPESWLLLTPLPLPVHRGRRRRLVAAAAAVAVVGLILVTLAWKRPSGGSSTPAPVEVAEVAPREAPPRDAPPRRGHGRITLHSSIEHLGSPRGGPRRLITSHTVPWSHP